MDFNNYRQVLLSSNLGFLLCKIRKNDLQIIEYNSLFSKILKVDLESLKNKLLSELIEDKNLSLSKSLISQFLSISNFRITKSTEFYSESNKLWFKINAIITDDDHISFIIEEISKYKTKNIELENFFSLNLDLLCIADTEGNFLKLNKEWENTLGYTIEELQGRKFYDFIHPDDLESTFEAIKSLSKQIDLKNFVNRYMCKDGTYKWIEWRSKPNGRMLFAAAKDITDKIINERELKKSINKFDLLLEKSLDIIYAFSKDGTIQYVSKSWLNLFSCTANQTNKINFFDLIHPDDKINFMLFMENIRKPSSISHEIEHRIIFNNQIEIFKTVISQVQNTSGEPEMYIANSISITAKKQIELKLIENEAKFKNLFYNHTAIKLIINPLNGQIVDANTSASDFYGWSIEELKSMYIYDINTLSKDEINKLMQNVKENNLNNFEVKHRKKDGSLCDVEIFSSSFNNHGDIFLHSIIHDITYKKATERLLHETKQTFINIFNSLTEAIYILDKNFSFIEVNKGAEEMYKYAKHELIGKTPADISAPGYNDLSSIINQLNELFINGGTVSFEFWAVKKNGQIFPKDVIVTKGFYFGDEVLIATARDITNRKKLESELKESNAAKDKFLSIIAHDLRSPFNGIMGLSSILNENIQNNNFKNASIITEKILKSSENTLNLLGDLMNWARAQTKNIDVNLIKISVPKIISEITEIFAPNFQKKSIIIKINSFEEVDILGDLEMTKTILRNLINNSIKFCKPGDLIEISWIKNGTFTEICIKDSGIGMNEKILNGLFQIDKTVSRQGTEREPGTGLGLILCKEFAELQNGNIRASSIENKGSSLYLSLPTANL